MEYVCALFYFIIMGTHWSLRTEEDEVAERLKSGIVMRVSLSPMITVQDLVKKTPAKTKCSHNVTGMFYQCNNIATSWQQHCENLL